MKKTLPLSLLIGMFVVTACAAPIEPGGPVLVDPAVSVETEVPTPETASDAATVATSNTYSNADFGLSFQIPDGWYGPDEYISDQTLRVAVGSDVVYPYGEPPAEPSTVTNSYSVVVQYTKGTESLPANETYQALSNLQDGESVSGTRGMMTRVRAIEANGLMGFEYISTLSESAQTEAFYSREVILIDEQGNVLTVFGTPNNVEVAEGQNWREIYQSIDEANQAAFHQIVDSIVVE